MCTYILLPALFLLYKTSPCLHNTLTNVVLDIMKKNHVFFKKIVYTFIHTNFDIKDKLLQLFTLSKIQTYVRESDFAFYQALGKKN